MSSAACGAAFSANAGEQRYGAPNQTAEVGHGSVMMVGIWSCPPPSSRLMPPPPMTSCGLSPALTAAMAAAASSIRSTCHTTTVLSTTRHPSTTRAYFYTYFREDERLHGRAPCRNVIPATTACSFNRASSSAVPPAARPSGGPLVSPAPGLPNRW